MSGVNEIILSVRDLRVHYEMETEVVEALNGVSFDLKKGKTLGLVGETGAGKTTIALSILRLISTPGRILDGSIMYEGKDLLRMPEKSIRKMRGNEISMIFQDPMSSLNPVKTVGEQVAEVFLTHRKTSKIEAKKMAIDMLEMVGIPGSRYQEYPHQFSGGMRQRVIIAEALACNPNLLIADEPTTALDVTIQAQVLELIRNLQNQMGMSMILITHDMGVVAEICKEVAVIYAGNIVEYGSVDQLFFNPCHPYTKGLFDSLPSLYSDSKRLIPIKGVIPNPADLPPYCTFYERCPVALKSCCESEPEYVEVESGHLVRCKLFG